MEIIAEQYRRPERREERRRECREMHIDRRKSGVDVIEHVFLGVSRTLYATSHDRPPRSRRR